MKEIEIGFACLPNNFQTENNFIFNSLSKKYKVILSSQPEYLFFSTFAGERPKSRVRISFTGENRRPNLSNCDWAFGFDHNEDIDDYRYMRLPLYVLYTAGMRDFWYQLPQLLNKTQDSEMLREEFSRFQEKNFCVYIAANETDFRAQAFDLISQFKQVTAPGKSKNNADPIEADYAMDSRLNTEWQQAKINYMKNFKFALVFENSRFPGYTTEKIVDAMVAGCIPIYWGNPDVHREFNPHSFYDFTPYVDKTILRLPKFVNSSTDRISRKLVHLTKKKGLKQAVEHFIYSQSCDEMLFEKFCQPWLSQQQLNEWFDFSRYENRLFEIIEN